MVKKVAIVGAGAAGLVTLHKLTSQPEELDIVGFERAGEIGGLWVYTDKIGTDVDGLPVHSSMYKNVRTNLPTDLVKFSDFSYPDSLPSYVGQKEVLEYLQGFADKYELRQYIKFNTLVTRINPLSPGSRDTRWEVTYCNRFQQSDTTTDEFDFVIVCNGHISVPYIPEFPGQESFTGTVLHSHDYKVPETFQGQTVLCVGGGPTAVDLPIDLDGVAKKVIVSRREDCQFEFVSPPSAIRHPGISQIKENSVVFTNGSVEEVDVILLCTGYQYSYPFFTDACHVMVEDEGRRVTPLYKHMVHIEHHTMMFIDIPDFCAAFNLSDVQATLVAKIVTGAVTLPERGEMMKDTDDEIVRRIRNDQTKGTRHFHKIGFFQEEYWDSLMDMAGGPRVPKGYSLLFRESIELYSTDSTTYKSINYQVVGDSFNILPYNA